MQARNEPSCALQLWQPAGKRLVEEHFQFRAERWRSRHAFVQTPFLFVIGAVAWVLLYLFLLNFPPIGIRIPTAAGGIPLVVLAATTTGLTAGFLRAEGWSAPSV